MKARNKSGSNQWVVSGGDRGLGGGLFWRRVQNRAGVAASQSRLGRLAAAGNIYPFRSHMRCLNVCPIHKLSSRMLASSSNPIPPHKLNNRPRGLWKARVTAPRFTSGNLGPDRQEDAFHDSDTTDDELDTHSLSDSIKRAKYDDSDTTLSTDEEDCYYWDYSRQCSPIPEGVNRTRTPRVMDISTTAGGGSHSDREVCDYEDWEDLKALFAKAAEHYESALSSITELASTSHLLVQAMMHQRRCPCCAE